MVVTSVPQMDFLLRLMEMYVTIGLEVKRNLQADREPANRVKSKGRTDDTHMTSAFWTPVHKLRQPLVTR